MKKFYTPEYIAPIIDEIKSKFEPETRPEVLKALNAKLLLKNKKSNDYRVIRETCFFYYGEATRKLYKELDTWTEAAETEPGELDTWKYKEQDRIQEATRKAILNEFLKSA